MSLTWYLRADWLEYFIPQCGQSPQIAAWLDCWCDTPCDVEAPAASPVTLDIPASSNRAWDCSDEKLLSPSVLSCCSDSSTSGSYSMSDFGDCFSGFTKISSLGTTFIGLFVVELVHDGESLVVSLLRDAQRSVTFDTFLVDELILALISLFEGFIPEK